MSNQLRRRSPHLLSFVQTATLLLTASFALLTHNPAARADGIDLFGHGKFASEARFASNTGNVAFLAAGTLLPLVEGGQHKTQQSVRVIDSLLTATFLTEGFKRLAREERPDGSSSNSFPSGHAAAAFAVATMQAHYHPRQAPLWYTGAALIGASRVQLERHYWHDVLAGGAVGYLTARYELKSKHGLILRPFVHADAQELGSRAAVLDGFNGRARMASAGNTTADGFAPYIASSNAGRDIGLCFSRSF